MRYKHYSIIALSLLVFMLLAITFLIANRHEVESNGETVGSKVIVIDPGHGGVDGGSSVSADFLEKDINLDIALKLGKLLERSGAQVIFTREADVSLERVSDMDSSRYRRDLDARKDIINRSNADVFVSIHTNCYTRNPNFRGAIAFYSKNNIKSQVLCENLGRSIDEQVYIGYLKNTHLKTEILPARFYVLRNANIPGALVEVGFLSNYEENRLLHQEEYKNAMAQALCDGVIGYFEVEKDVYKPAKDYMMEIFSYLLEQN